MVPLNPPPPALRFKPIGYVLAVVYFFFSWAARNTGGKKNGIVHFLSRWWGPFKPIWSKSYPLNWWGHVMPDMPATHEALLFFFFFISSPVAMGRETLPQSPIVWYLVFSFLILPTSLFLFIFLLIRVYSFILHCQFPLDLVLGVSMT